MSEPVTIEGEVLQRAETAGDGRTVTIRMVGWDRAVRTPEGYREGFRRGAFDAVEPRRVTIESVRHGGSLVGRGDAIRSEDDGAYLDARISRTPAGDELLALIDDGVLTRASVSYVPGRSSTEGDIQWREAVDLWRVAVVERGVHPDAAVVAVRSASDGRSEMSETPAIEPIAPDTDAIIERAMAPVLARLTEQDARLDRAITLAAVPSMAPLPGSDAGSLGELLLRAYDLADGQASRLISRALVDQITTDNLALMGGNAFISDVVGMVRASRPSIEAFGGARSLPESGMSVEWPKVIPPASEPIAVQTAEKTEVHSVKVSFGSDSEPIVTYAGASDISIQLLRRSSPSYRDLYARTMLNSYAKVTNAAFAAKVLAEATGAVDYALAGDTTGSNFIGALFNASVIVQQQTGAPASFALVATDVYLKIGGWLRPVNPQNAGGTGNAAGLNVDFSGLSIILDSSLPAGTILVSNRQTASWLEDGPNSLEATDVARLGTNVAYWGLGVGVVPMPAAVVKLYDVP